MSQYRVRIVHPFRRSVESVFSTLSDHEQLSRVFGIPVKRIQDGRDGDVNGVGSVRRIGMGPLAIAETVTGIEPDQSIHYKITRGGFPIRNHRGDLRFSKTAEGCSVQWNIDFDSALPGAGVLVRTVLTQALSRGLRRLD